MASDDLDAPLGVNKKTRRRFALPLNIPIGLPIAAFLMLCLAGFAGWALLKHDPLGGEPMIVISTNLGGKGTPAEPDAPPGAPAAAHGTTAPPAGAGTAPDSKKPPAEAAAAKAPEHSGPTITVIDGSTGERQEIKVSAATTGPASEKTPQKAPEKAPAIDPKLLETTRHGQVPRVSLDGKRPSIAYASPVQPANPALPKVALIVGGLGISASATAEAIEKLPSAVTLAFVPYAGKLEDATARARNQGHEVLLQLPMEPFDYPDNDPGPQTLLTSLAPEQNVDRMHWLMSRFQGYVGVANLMGARFTATEASFAPVLREVAKRGLIYLDDGASPRSLASQIAGANNMPFARANVLIDQIPTEAEVDRALLRLEAIARQDGVAIGMASALPLSLERLAQWTKIAEGRGFALVPLTAVTSKAKGS